MNAGDAGNLVGDVASAADRPRLVRRSARLNVVTLAYNVVEAVVSVGAGLVAGSIALVGFGIDSGIELAASTAALRRLHLDHDPERRERSERRTLRLIGALFLLLGAYVTIDSALALWRRDAPERSPVGVIILALSVVVMPVLARAKRRVARALGSGALVAESKQTSLCAWLSAIVLAGVGLNALLGWWWADPAAALAMVPIIAREGVEGVRGEAHCDDGCP